MKTTKSGRDWEEVLYQTDRDAYRAMLVEKAKDARATMASCWWMAGSAVCCAVAAAVGQMHHGHAKDWPWVAVGIVLCLLFAALAGARALCLGRLAYLYSLDTDEKIQEWYEREHGGNP